MTLNEGDTTMAIDSKGFERQGTSSEAVFEDATVYPVSLQALRFTRAWTTLGFVLVGAITYLSLAPAPSFSGPSFPHSDKMGHIAAYAAMMIWFGQVSRKRVVSVLVACGLALLGVALEFLQDTTGYRTFEYLDMAANATGVTIGLFLSWTKLGTLLQGFESLFTKPSDRKGT